MIINVNKQDNIFNKVISKVTGYVYDVIAIEIDSKHRVISYKINNHGCIEWWNSKRFNIVEKKITQIKRYMTRCNECGNYVPCDVIEEIEIH